MKNIGLSTIGAPNSIGSLTPNNAGINATRPIFFWTTDFDKRHQKTRPKVTPVPVKLANADTAPPLS